MDTLHAFAELPTSPTAADGARTFVRVMLTAWDCDDPDNVAVLLTSEVVTNAIRHAASRSALAVSLELDEDLLRIDVADRSSVLPTLRHPGPTDPGGRGLMMVAALARQWGAELSPLGKVVWFSVVLGSPSLTSSDRRGADEAN